VTLELGATAAARAAALIDLGRDAEAAPLLERALAERPNDAELLDLLTQAQLEIDPQAAAETASSLAAVAPHSHRGHLLGSLAAMKLRRRREAVEHARRAVALAPSVPMVHAQLAQTMAMGRLIRRRRAMKVARRAIDLAPDSTVGYIATGNVELASGSARRAEKWYRKALELEPSSGAAQVNLAITDRARGRLNSAYAGILARLEADPSDQHALRLLDGTLWRTASHLQWIVLVLLFVVLGIRGG
jgi:tetratricopeptide (TPR) repeat protein